MKVPPKRKGNGVIASAILAFFSRLNESPSEKEGKFLEWGVWGEGKRKSLNESPSEKEGKYDSADRIRHATERLNESPSEKEGKSRT